MLPNMPVEEPEQNPSEEELNRIAYEYAVTRLEEGAAKSEVKSELIEKGYESTYVRELLDDIGNSVSATKQHLRASPSSAYSSTAQQQGYNQAVRAAAQRSMLIGGVICVIGLVVTFGSMAAASSGGGGGRYFIAWGAVVFGGIQFFRGVAMLPK